MARLKPCPFEVAPEKQIPFGNDRQDGKDERTPGALRLGFFRSL
jgi:hypothetical protein